MIRARACKENDIKRSARIVFEKNGLQFHSDVEIRFFDPIDRNVEVQDPEYPLDWLLQSLYQNDNENLSNRTQFNAYLIS